MPNMKQGTLAFQSVKRTNSAPDAKSQKRTEKGKNKRSDASAQAQDDSQPSEILEISSDEEVVALEITVPAKRTRASAKAHPSPGTKKRAASQPSPSEKIPSPAEIDREHLDAEDKAGRYRKYSNEVKSKIGYKLKPIHSEGQNKIHQMLRFFDMSYEFGPCIGMTRLERWERAEALGLDPPVEVRDILLTKEGSEHAGYAQCVLHGEV